MYGEGVVCTDPFRAIARPMVSPAPARSRDPSERALVSAGGGEQGSTATFRPPPALISLAALFHQPFELVVDVLYLFAGEQVWLADAGDALDELADLAAVGAPVVAGQPGEAGEREHASDLRLGGGSGVAAGAETHERVVVESRRLGCQVTFEQHP